MPKRSMQTTIAVVAVAATTLALNAAFSAPAGAATPRHVLSDSAATWLAKAHDAGAVAANSTVSFGITLRMRNGAAAEAELARISTPGSASYGKWLSNRQFNAAYAPSAASVHAVQTWLRGNGLHVDTTLPSGMLIEVSGSAAHVAKAFGTSLRNYRYQGGTLRANTSALSLAGDTPASVLSAVSGVIGIDEGALTAHPAKPLPGPAPGHRYGVQPCSQYYGQKIATDKPSAYGKKQPYAVCGYAPNQYQSAYGESSLLAKGIDGRGVTVAITDAYASPTILADAQKYSSVHNQPLFKAGQFSQITVKPNNYRAINYCGAQGWYGEETLDVEAVHAMAPGANIVYLGGRDCGPGLDVAWATAIDYHVADIVTNSWSFGSDSRKDIGQPLIDFFKQYSLEAALTGITDSFSTGDDGDFTKGGTVLSAKHVGFPSDLPYVTGAGGTSVEIGSNGQWLGEYGWQNSYSPLVNGAWTPTPPGVYSSGGGGGTSVLFGQPFYQKGVVPARISQYYGGKPMRALPDISMPGDPNTGFLVGQTQVFPDGTYWDQYRIGGTSLASPLLAGVIAVASQYAGKPLGFINPLVYKLNGTSALHDIVAPSSPVAQVRTNFVNAVDKSAGKAYILQTVDAQTSTLHSTPGYDDETGVGTPGGTPFFGQIAAVANG